MTNFTTRFWANVNKTESCWLWMGKLQKGGYGRATLNGKQMSAHRIAYEMSGAVIPDGMDIDHICRNRACVRPDHLRTATRKENNENISGAYKNSKSGVRGVNKRGERWRVQVGHNGRLISVGTYDTIEEAEAAAIAKRLELFTHNELDQKAA